MKSVAILTFLLGITAPAAEAATLVSFSGNANGALATGSASISLNANGDAITGTLTNTSPFDARVTGFGFNVGPGNLAGFTGTPDPITSPSGVNFDFRDDALGNVPQFNGVELDFAYVTGPNPNFAGGFPNDGLKTAQMLNFVISGAFAGLTEEQIASGLFVHFQNVGANGQLSDVATPGNGSPGVPTPFSTVPEPTSMMLLGSGLVYLAGRKYKSANL